MHLELAVRFVLGGVLVCAFALLGETFRPKTFSGLFGSAPSVALASLALAFAKEGGGYVAREAPTMLIGAFALGVYCSTCVATMRRRHVPVWAMAGASLAVWFAVSFALLGVARRAGLLQ